MNLLVIGLYVKLNLITKVCCIIGHCILQARESFIHCIRVYKTRSILFSHSQGEGLGYRFRVARSRCQKLVLDAVLIRDNHDVSVRDSHDVSIRDSHDISIVRDSMHHCVNPHTNFVTIK